MLKETTQLEIQILEPRLHSFEVVSFFIVFVNPVAAVLISPEAHKHPFRLFVPDRADESRAIRDASMGT